MSDDYQSIEDLISSSQGEEVDKESIQGKFIKKQEEIKIKEMERQVKRRAAQMGVPYVDLFGFPISPEALMLIKEEEAEKIKAVCFLYDGENLRMAAIDPKDEIIINKFNELNEQYYTKGKLYLMSDHSLKHALKLYKMLPKVRKFVAGVEIKEEDLERLKEDIENYKSLGRK